MNAIGNLLRSLVTNPQVAAIVGSAVASLVALGWTALQERFLRKHVKPAITNGVNKNPINQTK